MIDHKREMLSKLFRKLETEADVQFTNWLIRAAIVDNILFDILERVVQTANSPIRYAVCVHKDIPNQLSQLLKDEDTPFEQNVIWYSHNCNSLLPIVLIELLMSFQLGFTLNVRYDDIKILVNSSEVYESRQIKEA